MSTFPERSPEDPDAGGRDFNLTQDDFNALRALVHRTTGISLAENKRNLVYGRLSRRLRAQAIPAQAVAAIDRHRQLCAFVRAPAVTRQAAAKIRSAIGTRQTPRSRIF